VKISYGGSPPKEGCLLLNPSIVAWVVMTAFVSHERVLAN
jgi:hypothetical protein